MIPSDEWTEDCLKWHGVVLTGKKWHWCIDWDGLPIDETTAEFQCCTCTFDDEPTEPVYTRIAIPDRVSVIAGLKRPYSSDTVRIVVRDASGAVVVTLFVGPGEGCNLNAPLPCDAATVEVVSARRDEIVVFADACADA